LLDHRDLLALNVYVALCYAKLDYYDVSSEILQVLGAALQLRHSSHIVLAVSRRMVLQEDHPHGWQWVRLNAAC